MNDFEEFANQRALEKASKEMENRYLDKALSKEAFFKNTATRFTQGVKKMTGKAAKNSKGFEGMGKAIAGDTRSVIKKNPLTTAGVAAVGGAALTSGGKKDD